MATDATASDRVAVPGGLSRGTNQAGVRLYNERLVLSMIRRHKELPKAEIARATGLSPQTISNVTNQLTADGLLLKGKPQRGRIGQPSVPYSLNPEGAYAFGLKIGRRSADLHLINFTGEIIRRVHEIYPYPTPRHILDFAAHSIAEFTKDLSEEVKARICGLGIASPYEMWTWPEEIGAPMADIDAWRAFDIQSEVAKLCPWPVYYSNDITAACAAELMFGRGDEFPDYLYVYIGTFIGGGLVLDGHLFPGRTQNAGALGSMLCCAPQSDASNPVQLIKVASIHVLERLLIEDGRDPSVLWNSPDDWGDLGPALDTWISELAENVAFAIVSAVAVIDVQTIIIDGAFPPYVRSRVIDATEKAIGRLSLQGLSPFQLTAGSIGNAARAMGGATIPLLANFTQDREVLFKETSAAMR